MTAASQTGRQTTAQGAGACIRQGPRTSKPRDCRSQAKIPALDLAVDFAADEELHTEISAKFRKEGGRAGGRGARDRHRDAVVPNQPPLGWSWRTGGRDSEGRFALSPSVVR
jgi:hypothetical protein